jgi:hypothetical protein
MASNVGSGSQDTTANEEPLGAYGDHVSASCIPQRGGKPVSGLRRYSHLHSTTAMVSR